MSFSRRFYIGFRSVDSELRLKNSELLNMLVDMAIMQAETCGERLGDSNRRWLLHGYRVNFIERPRYGTEIEISTWPTFFKNITSTREFEVRDTEGRLLATVLSDWSRVDITTRRLVKITPEEVEAYHPDPTHTNYNEFKMPRIYEPEGCDYEKNVFVDWKYIDMYGHMNNTYYMDIAEHVLPEDVQSILPELDFDVVYKQEIPENTEIRCLCSESDDAYTVCFKSADGSVLHAIVKFHKRKDTEEAPIEEGKKRPGLFKSLLKRDK